MRVAWLINATGVCHWQHLHLLADAATQGAAQHLAMQDALQFWLRYEQVDPRSTAVSSVPTWRHQRISHSRGRATAWPSRLLAYNEHPRAETKTRAGVANSPRTKGASNILALPAARHRIAATSGSKCDRYLQRKDPCICHASADQLT